MVPLGPVPHAATTPSIMTDASFKIVDARTEHRASCMYRPGVTLAHLTVGLALLGVGGLAGTLHRRRIQSRLSGLFTIEGVVGV